MSSSENKSEEIKQTIEYDLSDICPYSVRNCNPKNKLITEEHIQSIFKQFNIEAKINSLDPYYLAFVHKTYLQATPEQLAQEPDLTQVEYTPEYSNWIALQIQSYERLEFLGDSILGAVISDYIYHRYPDEAEGFMTKLKTKLVRGTNLCVLSKKLQFHKFVLLSKGYEAGRINNDVLEDLLEAFIGAIYLDFGSGGLAYGICQDFIIRLMERYLNMSQFARRQDNYKDILLRYYHKNFNGANPEYVQISTYGPTNDRTFKAGVTNLYKDVIATGEGTKLVFAQQMAAKAALKYFKQEVYSDSEEPVKEIFSDSEDEMFEK